MSKPQHIGDLILPHPSGHLATETSRPSAVVMVSGTSSLLHAAHSIPTTPIPQDEHEY